MLSFNMFLENVYNFIHLVTLDKIIKDLPHSWKSKTTTVTERYNIEYRIYVSK